MFSSANHAPCSPDHSSCTVPQLNPKRVIASQIKVTDSPGALCHCPCRRADCALWECSTFVISLHSRHALNRSHKKKHIKFNSMSLRMGRSQWPRGLRYRSSVARPLRLWVRIPPRAWMFVCLGCCVLSGRGVCDGLITRPEESYRLWCVVACDQETSKLRRLKPATRL